MEWRYLSRSANNKFGAIRTLHPDGTSFSSKLEAATYCLLKLREYAGEIKEIKKQQCVRLGEDTRWKIDFSFIEVKSGELVYAESKGIPTNDYLRKLKLFKKYSSNRLEIYKGSYQNPVLIETVIPDGYNKQRG